MYLATISDDPTLQGVFVSICTQIELNYSICASSFACLGPFISPFSNDNGLNYKDTRYLHNRSFGKQGGTDYHLSLVNVSGNHTQSKSTITNNKKSLHTAVGEILTTINHDVSPENETSQGTQTSSRLKTKQENNNTDRTHAEQRQSLETNDSQRMIIQKRMSWSVERVDGAPGDMDECPNAVGTIGSAV